MQIHKDVEKVLFSESDLAEVTQKIADKVNTDYQDKELLVVGVLKGSILFLADLFRSLTVDCKLDFVSASSYGNGTVSSGKIAFKKAPDADLKGKNILLVEDILDTGNTLYFIKNYMYEQGAESVKVCTLFDKPSRRQKPITADYYGMTVPDLFIVGYGLDYDERYRNLPYIGVLKPEIYKNN